MDLRVTERNNYGEVSQIQDGGAAAFGREIQVGDGSQNRIAIDLLQSGINDNINVMNRVAQVIGGGAGVMQTPGGPVAPQVQPQPQ